MSVCKASEAVCQLFSHPKLSDSACSQAGVLLTGSDKSVLLQVTDKLVDKIGVQRTPNANPEDYKSEDYSAHLKGSNKTMMEREEEASKHV